MAHEGQISREEQARLELGHTDIGRATALCLTVAFFAIIVTVPLHQIVIEPPTVAPRGLPAAPAPDSAGFDPLSFVPAPDEIAAFERDLENRSFLRRLLVGPVTSLLVRLGGAGTEKVYIGRDGWLFYRNDVDFLIGAPFLDEGAQQRGRRDGRQPDPVRAIVHFRDELARRGIDLLVMPVPVKATVHPEKLAAGATAPRYNRSYVSCLAALQSAGIEIFDPTPILLEMRATAEGAYLGADTHWTPGAAQQIAAALAERIEGDNSRPNESPFIVRNVRVSGRGDIAAMLDLPPGAELSPAQTVNIRRILTPAGAPCPDDADSPILFLGDSFANIYSREEMGWGSSAGLVEQLALALGRPLDRITINDAAAHATREALARDLAAGIDRLRGKRLVIFEFVAREFAQGDWRLIDLPDVKAGTNSPAGPDQSGISVAGSIRAITAPPRPGGPYRDAIIAIHLGDVTDSTGARRGDLVVFTWGLRGDRPTEATRRRSGQRFSGRLSPWSVAQTRYGSHARIEFDDPALLRLPAYWLLDESPALAAEPPIANEPPSRNVTAPRFTAFDPPSLWESASARNESVIRGADGFLFLAAEVRSLTVGPFWGADAAGVSRATNPAHADPLPAILDFHRQLAERDIRLIMVPVPAKARVHADRLPGWSGVAPAAWGKATDRFHDILRAKGITVLDLTSAFAAVPATEPAYCRSDTHWSPRGIDIAAGEIARAIGRPDWMREIPRRSWRREAEEISFIGDLSRMAGDPDPIPETVNIERVLDLSGSAAGSWRESPILLLGDSHCLVFHQGGDLYAEGSGLPDHLAAQLGFPVDLVAVRGSGATAARISLARRGDALAGTRVVIWCFAARDYTEAVSGWRPIPLTPAH